ncbi:HAD family hydrolase [Tannockella kyphosi]|uniref:HAD family hydrolase n=1 Tax=Tannockella kyphosi TaxID=2899121 RepID=UPI002012D183|nr:HAD hydrolase-like protein [Tannockella kyphosi]
MLYEKKKSGDMLVILTLDGGMLDLNRLRFNYLKNIFKEHGKEVSVNTFVQGIGDYRTMYQAFSNTPLELNNEIENDLYAYSKLKPELKKVGVEELLHFFKQREIKVAVISTHSTKRAVQYLQLTNLYNKVDFVIGNDGTAPFPNKETLQLICHSMEVGVENTLLVANFSSMVKAANDAFIQIAYLHDLGEYEPVHAITPFEVVKNNLGVINVILFSKYDSIDMYSTILGLNGNMNARQLTSVYEQLLKDYANDEQLLTLIERVYTHYYTKLPKPEIITKEPVIQEPIIEVADLQEEQEVIEIKEEVEEVEEVEEEVENNEALIQPTILVPIIEENEEVEVEPVDDLLDQQVEEEIIEKEDLEVEEEPVIDEQPVMESIIFEQEQKEESQDSTFIRKLKGGFKADAIVNEPIIVVPPVTDVTMTSDVQEEVIQEVELTEEKPFSYESDDDVEINLYQEEHTTSILPEEFKTEALQMNALMDQINNVEAKLVEIDKEPLEEIEIKESSEDKKKTHKAILAIYAVMTSFVASVILVGGAMLTYMFFGDLLASDFIVINIMFSGIMFIVSGISGILEMFVQLACMVFPTLGTSTVILAGNEILSALAIQVFWFVFFFTVLILFIRAIVSYLMAE